MTTAQKLEAPRPASTDAPPESYPNTTAAEAHAVVEMRAQVFDLVVPTFRSTNLPSPTEQRRLAPVTEGHDAIVTVNDDAIITSFSDAAQKIFDYPAGAVIGGPVAILFDSAGVSRSEERKS